MVASTRAATRTEGRRRRQSPPSLRGGCCTSTRTVRPNDFVGAHEDFGASRDGNNSAARGNGQRAPEPAGYGKRRSAPPPPPPPPLSGGCFTSTRGVRSEDATGVHQDLEGSATAMARHSAPAAAAGPQRETPHAVVSSLAAALPWRPPSHRAQIPTTEETRLVPSQEIPTALQPELEVPSTSQLEPRPELGLSLELPWRLRRAYNWEGDWREDREQQVGMKELYEALDYPWHIRQIMKAAPGPSWMISSVALFMHFCVARDMSDDGHTLSFDTNSKILNKLIQLAPVVTRYGDDDETAPRYEQPPFADDLAPRTEHTWWVSPTKLCVKDEWVECDTAMVKAMRGKKCSEETSLEYFPPSAATVGDGGKIVLRKRMYVDGLLPPDGMETTQVMRREGPPPEQID